MLCGRPCEAALSPDPPEVPWATIRAGGLARRRETKEKGAKGALVAEGGQPFARSRADWSLENDPADVRAHGALEGSCDGVGPVPD
jgi:hypothetical protein